LSETREPARGGKGGVETEHSMEKPFMVKAVQAHKEKNELKFKKGQLITVEKINEEGTHYHGFYGKKQGWFPIHYAAIADGSDPILRKKVRYQPFISRSLLMAKMLTTRVNACLVV
jgi:hypothetical protein